MSSFIGYNNLVKSGAIISTSGDAVGYEKENAQSWKTSTWWKADDDFQSQLIIDMGTAVDVDWFGIAGHDIAANSSNYYIDYSLTGAFLGEEVLIKGTTTPTEDVTIFENITLVNARYFRFVFNVSDVGTAAHIGNLFLGEALQLERGMPQGFSPANLNRKRNILNNKSNSGNFLGRIIKHEGAEIKINQKTITRTWIDANWTALADSIELYPFYFLWDSVTYANEAAYCIAKKITYPSYSDTLNLDFTIDCMALYDL